MTNPTVHVNGDHAQYLDHVFRMNWVDGEPFAADDESVEAGWFELDGLPPVSAHMRRRIGIGLEDDPSAATIFDVGDASSH